MAIDHLPNGECKIADGRVEPCRALSACTELYGQGTRYQGVKLLSFIDTSTNKFSRNLYSLKSGDHGKRGVIMNFCPFCGKCIVPGSALEEQDAA